MPNIFFDKLTEEENGLGLRIFSLVINRVLKRIYSGFDEKTRLEMENVFRLEDNKEKEEFLKKNVPDFKKIFAKEAKKVEEELRLEVEKQL